MRVIYFILLFLASILEANADNQINTVKGHVADDNGMPLTGCLVSLLHLPDSTLIENVVTDSTGVFVLKKDNGTLDSTMLVFSCIGYERQRIVLNKSNEDILIILKEISHQLKGVTVTAKSTVKGMPGGFAFTPGGAEMLLQDGLELLKVTPMLDVQGGVNILGKGSAKVYINGRDPHMPVDMVLEMLRTVPPKSVKRVEIICNTDASNRASDQSGIVNIIMKRPDYGWIGQALLNGYNQNDRLSGGSNVYLGYGHGKFRFSVGANFGYKRGLTKDEQQYEYKEDALNVRNEFSKLDKTLRGGLNVNATYDITENHQVGVAAGVGLIGGKDRNETVTTLTDNNAGTVQQYRQVLKADVPVRLPSYSLAAFYTLTTDSHGSLEVSASYSKNKQETADTMSVMSDMEREGWSTTPYMEQNRGNSHGIGLEAKYTKFFKDGSFLRAGAAYDMSHIDNDNQFLDLIDESYVNNRQRSNRFVYDENVAGAYVNYNRTWSKMFSSSVGLRAEYTHTHGNQHTTGETFSHDWLHWFPNVGLSFNSHNRNHIVGIDYSTFIWRPTFNNVNPFKYWTSSNTYSMGNPDMSPGKIHFLELSYRFLQWYKFSVRGLYSPSLMGSYTVQDGNGVSKTGYGDLGRSRSVNFNLSAYRSFFGGMWYLDGFIHAGYAHSEGKVEAYPMNSHHWGYGARIISTVMFNKARDFSMKTMYVFTGKRHNPSETRPADHYVTMSISKAFGFGGTVELYFRGTFPWKDKTFYETSTYYRQSRNLTSPTVFGISFMQRFGKKRVRGAEEREKSKFENRMQ